MAPDPVLVNVDHILVNVAFLVSVIFVPATSLFWPWWKSQWGLNIVLLELCISGTLFSSFLYLDFGFRANVLQWVQAVFLGLVPVIIAWRAIMIWIEQNQAPRKMTDSGQVRLNGGQEEQEQAG